MARKVITVDGEDLVIKSYTHCPMHCEETHICKHPRRDKMFRSPACVSTNSVLCPLKDAED